MGYFKRGMCSGNDYKSKRGVGLVGILLRYSKYVSRKKDAMRLDVRRDIVKKIIGTEFNVKCRALQTAPIFKGVRRRFGSRCRT